MKVTYRFTFLLVVCSIFFSISHSIKAEGTSTINTSKLRAYSADKISLKGTAKRDSISFYYNQKGKMRYVVSSTKGTYIYKRIAGEMIKDRKDPFHKFTRRKDRTRPYDGYTTPIWAKDGKSWYTVHFSSIYKCDNKGKIIKRFNVMQKLGLDGNRNWIWDICKLQKNLWALEIHNAKESTSRIYIVDFKKEKIIKKINKQYSYIHGTSGKYLYVSKFVKGKGHTKLAKVSLKNYKVVKTISTTPIRNLMENKDSELEFISTVYKGKLYFRHYTGIYSWNEKTNQFDQLIDGSHPSIGNMEYGYFRFLSPDTIYTTGYAMDREDYSGSLYKITLN